MVRSTGNLSSQNNKSNHRQRHTVEATVSIIIRNAIIDVLLTAILCITK